MTVEKPDGFEEVENQDSDVLELEPGDEIKGVVLDIKSGETEQGRKYHLITLMTEDQGEVRYFAEGDAKRAVSNEQIKPADEIWVGKVEEPDVFETDEGEEKEYFPVKVAVKNL